MTVPLYPMHLRTPGCSNQEQQFPCSGAGQDLYLIQHQQQCGSHKHLHTLTVQMSQREKSRQSEPQPRFYTQTHSLDLCIFVATHVHSRLQNSPSTLLGQYLLRLLPCFNSQLSHKKGFAFKAGLLLLLKQKTRTELPFICLIH